MKNYRKIIAEMVSDRETVKQAYYRLIKSGIRTAQFSNQGEPGGGVSIRLDFDTANNKLTAYKGDEVVLRLGGEELWKKARTYFMEQKANGNLPQDTRFLVQTPTAEMRDVSEQFAA